MKKVGHSPNERNPGRPLPVKRKQRSMVVENKPAFANAAGLLLDLRNLIRSARQRMATVAYSTQTLLCWRLGRRLLTEILQGGIAAYGKQILVTLSQQLSWSHFHALLPIQDPLARAEVDCCDKVRLGGKNRMHLGQHYAWSSRLRP